MKAAELFPNLSTNAIHALDLSDAIDGSATEEDPTAGNMGAAFVEIEVFCSRQLITVVH